MSDLIPYEVIIERVKDDIDFIAEQAYERGKRDILEQLPSAQPEREKGQWILITDNNGQHFICNRCGTWRYHQGQAFCTNCGSDNRGKQDDGARDR